MPPAVGTVVRVRVTPADEERTGVVVDGTCDGITYVRIGNMIYSFFLVGRRRVSGDMMLICSTDEDEILDSPRLQAVQDVAILGSPRPQTEQAQAADSNDFYLAVDCS